MKVISVVGTRPNFVKEFFIHNELKRRGIKEILVHTGQHYDYEMSKVFFKDFNIADPDYHFENSSRSSTQQVANVITYMEEVLNKEKADCTLVYGDVNSTLAAAVASAKHRIPVAHVEGGIRSSNLYNPEEINRRVSDHLSMLIFACTRTDYDNLIKENFSEDRIVLSGDIMKDVILYIVKKDNIEVKRGDYSIVTIHREENVESEERLKNIILGLSMSGEKIIFPVHPRTKQKLEKFGLIENIVKNSRIEIRKPQSYREFIKLLAGADKVITDSGGVRREGYILNKPVIVLIDITWFPEILEAGWKVVVDADAAKIADAVKNFEPPETRPEIFGDGRAYKKIVDSLVDRFGDMR
jgi:UDP-GlcNAc3NAcA epimerase